MSQMIKSQGVSVAPGGPAAALNVVWRGEVTSMPSAPRQEVRVITGELNPGEATPRHSHRFPVIVYVLEGVFSLELGDGRLLSIREADGEALDLQPASFDAAISRLGLMFFPDPAAGLRQMHRALRPGGRACVMVFGPPEANPCVAMTIATALKHAGLPSRDPFAPGSLLSLGKPGLLDELFIKAGFAASQRRRWQRHSSCRPSTTILHSSGPQPDQSSRFSAASTRPHAPLPGRTFANGLTRSAR